MKKMLLLAIIYVFLVRFSSAQFTYTQVTNGLMDVYESGNTIFSVGDIDNDGDIDIISVGDHWSPLIPEEHGIMVFKNNGSGTAWTKFMSGNFGYGGVALGDVNNDGFLDVAYGVHHNYSSTDFGDQVLEVVLGDGTGLNWESWDDNLGQQGQTWGMFGCDLADVNNDGLLDLGSNSFGCCDGVWIYKNNGNGTWDTWAGALDLNSDMQFRFGDFDRDGLVDFIVCNTQFNNQAYQVWKNAGNGQFSPMMNGLPFGGYSFKLDVADVNHDGAADIAVTSGSFARVFSFDILSNAWVNISNGLPTTSQSLLNLSLGDLNADGYMDLMTFRSGLITIYTGDGAGNWVQASTLTVPETTCYNLKLADLDHNNYPDIMYWGKYNGSNMLRVYLQTTPVTELSITPLYPGGGELYCSGSVQFIKWTSMIPGGITATVSIEFSETGPAGPFSIVGLNLPNAGTWQWAIPAITAVDCYLRLTLNTGSNTYTALTGPFTIDACSGIPVIPGHVSGDTAACIGQTLTFSVPAAANTTSYTWTLPTGWSASSVTNTLSVVSGINSGWITVVANGPGGTSSPQSLFVSVVALDTSVTFSGSTLTAVISGASYRWMNCTTGNLVPGAQGQSFTPLVNGVYALIISRDGCTDTSACHTVWVTGIPRESSGNSLSVNPNPSGGIINLAGIPFIEELEILNAVGEAVIRLSRQQTPLSIDLSGFTPGIYHLRVKSPEGISTHKIVKMN